MEWYSIQNSPEDIANLHRPQLNSANKSKMLIIGGGCSLLIIIGMCLGLGLGIGAAGLVTDANLIAVADTASVV